MLMIYKIFLSFFQGILFTGFITFILVPTNKKMNRIAFSICSISTALSLSSYLFFQMPKWDIWIFIFVILYTFFILKGDFFQKIFWILTLISVTRGSSAICRQLVLFVFGSKLLPLPESSPFYYLISIFENLLLGVILFVFIKLFRKKVGQTDPSYLLLTIVLMCIFLEEILLTLGNEYNIPVFLILVGCIIVLTIAVVSSVVHGIMSEYIRKEQDYKYCEVMMQESREQNANIKVLYESMQRLRHDMNAYINDMKELSGTVGASLNSECFNKLTEQLKAEYHTGNIFLDSLFALKIPKIRNSNFAFRGINLHYTGGMNITDSALCSLISNMLDNAYEALIVRKNRPGEKYVLLQFNYSPGGLMIICENPLLGVPPKMQKNSFLSSKTELYHGLGVSIMEKIVSDAEGQFDIIIIDDLFKVLVSIPPHKENTIALH